MLYVYRFLWPLHLGWLLVCCLYKEVYLQMFKCVSFWLHGFCGKWEDLAHKPVNHTSWVAVVTPTDLPKSVRNRCVMELFCGVVCVVTLPFWHFCWCRGFTKINRIHQKSLATCKRYRQSSPKESGIDAKFNIQVWPRSFICNPAMNKMSSLAHWQHV